MDISPEEQSIASELAEYFEDNGDHDLADKSAVIARAITESYFYADLVAQAWDSRRGW